jgi:Zn-dependent peptidase ImmA (M78 family)
MELVGSDLETQGSRDRTRSASVGHEIGHTLDPAFTPIRHYRCNPVSAKTRIEVLSDIVASELLLPARHFRADLGTAGLTMDGIEQLANCRCGVAAQWYRRCRRDPARLSDLDNHRP